MVFIVILYPTHLNPKKKKSKEKRVAILIVWFPEGRRYEKLVMLFIMFILGNHLVGCSPNGVSRLLERSLDYLIKRRLPSVYKLNIIVVRLVWPKKRKTVRLMQSC